MSKLVNIIDHNISTLCAAGLHLWQLQLQLHYVFTKFWLDLYSFLGPPNSGWYM